MWLLKEGNNPTKQEREKVCVLCYFCSNVISNVLVFQLVEQCQCRKTLLHHATRLLPICIFLDSSAISVGLTNLSFMTVLSCFRLGFVLPIALCNTMSLPQWFTTSLKLTIYYNASAVFPVPSVWC